MHRKVGRFQFCVGKHSQYFFQSLFLQNQTVIIVSPSLFSFICSEINKYNHFTFLDFCKDAVSGFFFFFFNLRQG
jgi:hypothetical protein